MEPGMVGATPLGRAAPDQTQPGQPPALSLCPLGPGAAKDFGNPSAKAAKGFAKDRTPLSPPSHAEEEARGA